MTPDSGFPDADLARLARAHGVATSYEDQVHRPVTVSPEAVVGVLGALGVDASSPAAVRAALAEHRAQSPEARVAVVRRSRGGPVAVGGPALLRLEDGTHRTLANDGGQVLLPAGLPLGYHRLETGGRDIPIVVTPDRITPRTRRGWGWMVQLYALRSGGSWGIGDVTDLTTLAEWTARRGGGLVLVNPLHAVAPVPPIEPSPYYPGSRQWTNPVYLRPERTSAYAAAPAEVRAAVDALRVTDAPDPIDRNAAWAAKLDAFSLLAPHAEMAEMTDELRTFATWCALCERHGRDWRAWPVELRRPGSPGVAAAGAELAERVRFHGWLQQLADEQLAEAQRAALSAGMDVGIVHDLAVGADPAGADAWVMQEVLVLSARIGAPPDAFNQQGQDWGMPPWHPRALAEQGYTPLRDLVRSLVRHAGGVRIDHVLGMFRLWWIPEGASARDGTYVSYDAEALLGVIALEAERAHAVVVGEDLGTVPDHVRGTLSDRGVLGSSVLWFERDDAEPGKTGPLTPMDQWREAAMASVTTHDLPTALAWLRGDHIKVRARYGLLDDPVAEEAGWRTQRAELLDHIVAAGILPSTEVSEDELVRALHAYVAATPSRYVVAAPGDAIGELRQPNLPGTLDEYPNWRLPIADSSGRPVPLEELLADPRVERLAADLDRAVR